MFINLAKFDFFQRTFCFEQFYQKLVKMYNKFVKSSTIQKLDLLSSKFLILSWQTCFNRYSLIIECLNEIYHLYLHTSKNAEKNPLLKL
jgi:hypothetical protein